MRYKTAFGSAALVAIALAGCRPAGSQEARTPQRPWVPAAAQAQTKTVQTVRCDPVTGRYVRLRILSEVNGGPWASLAELGVLGQ